MERNLPNYITLLNLFCGFLGLLCCFNGELAYAGILVFAAAFFDVMDGLAARWLKVSSPLGKQLDSLADVVSFGVLPAAITHILLIKTKADWLFYLYIFGVPVFSLLPFAIAACAAWRLARFNIDTAQSHSFRGLPSPANGLFFASLPLMMSQQAFVVNFDIYYLSQLVLNPYLLIGVTILFSWLMVSRLPLFSFKLKSRRWADNRIVYLFIILSALLFVFLLWAAVPIILFLYLILSYFNKPGENEIQSTD